MKKLLTYIHWVASLSSTAKHLRHKRLGTSNQKTININKWTYEWNHDANSKDMKHLLDKCNVYVVFKYLQYDKLDIFIFIFHRILLLCMNIMFVFRSKAYVESGCFVFPWYNLVRPHFGHESKDLRTKQKYIWNIPNIFGIFYIYLMVCY